MYSPTKAFLKVLFKFWILKFRIRDNRKIQGAVISIPHEIKGETTVAFVVPQNVEMGVSSKSQLKEALTADISLQIAKFAVPRYIIPRYTLYRSLYRGIL